MANMLKLKTKKTGIKLPKSMLIKIRLSRHCHSYDFLLKLYELFSNELEKCSCIYRYYTDTKRTERLSG